MAAPVVYQANVVEDGDAYVLARIKRKDSSHNLVALKQADLTSISRRVWLLSDSTSVHGPTTLVIATVVLDTLNTGTIWTKDTTGFNFIDTVPAAAFPNKDRYRIEYKFTLTGAEVFWLRIDANAGSVLTS